MSGLSISNFFYDNGTWFAGVNVLPNDPAGEAGNSGPLIGSAIRFIREDLCLAEFAWDNAQVSVCYPGYPQPMAQESSSAFRYRRQSDAAHVDGLLPEGPRRRRHLREYHGPTTRPAKRCSMSVSVWRFQHGREKPTSRTD